MRFDVLPALEIVARGHMSDECGDTLAPSGGSRAPGIHSASGLSVFRFLTDALTRRRVSPLKACRRPTTNERSLWTSPCG